MNDAHQTPRTLPLTFATAWVALHTALLAACLFILLIRVPAAHRTFTDFQMKLPYLTERVFELSQWVADYWWLLLAPLILALAIDGGVLLALGGKRQSRPLAWLWAGLILIGLLAALWFFWLAIALPQAKLAEGLSK